MTQSDPHYFMVPEVKAVADIRSITNLLASKGYKVVCVGGAARDTWHNKPIKDLDFYVLYDPANAEVTPEFHCEAIESYLWSLGPINDVQAFNSSQGSGGDQVNWVIKGKIHGRSFDIISPKKNCLTPTEAVMQLDCTLNAAWFELTDTGAECHILPGCYPDMMDIPSVRLLYPKSCTAERIAYLQAKYPQYRYDINPDELIVPDPEET